MFDKYHLIHYEIKNALSENSNGRLSMTEGTDHTAADDTIKWSDLSGSLTSTHCSDYCLTGSFDMLLQTVPHKDNADALYLQSFCIMDNGRDYFTKRADYNSLLLSYTYSGEGRLVYNNQTYQIKKGQAFVIDCRLPHEYFSAAENWEHVDIHIWGQDADSLYRHFAGQNIVQIPYPQSSFNSLVERLLDSCITFSDHRNLFISNALTNLLCSLLERAEKDGSSSIPDTYKYVIRYMENNYMHPLSLDALSSFASLSKCHFAREFKKYTGTAPNDYLINLRIRHACILLAASDLSIEQITDEIGICNMSNFIKQFKKRTGLTPSAFRNMRKPVF